MGGGGWERIINKDHQHTKSSSNLFCFAGAAERLKFIDEGGRAQDSISTHDHCCFLQVHGCPREQCLQRVLVARSLIAYKLDVASFIPLNVLARSCLHVGKNCFLGEWIEVVDKGLDGRPKGLTKKNIQRVLLLLPVQKVGSFTTMRGRYHLILQSLAWSGRRSPGREKESQRKEPFRTLATLSLFTLLSLRSLRISSLLYEKWRVQHLEAFTRRYIQSHLLNNLSCVWYTLFMGHYKVRVAAAKSKREMTLFILLWKCAATDIYSWWLTTFPGTTASASTPLSTEKLELHKDWSDPRIGGQPPRTILSVPSKNPETSWFHSIGTIYSSLLPGIRGAKRDHMESTARDWSENPSRSSRTSKTSSTVPYQQHKITPKVLLRKPIVNRGIPRRRWDRRDRGLSGGAGTTREFSDLEVHQDSSKDRMRTAPHSRRRPYATWDRHKRDKKQNKQSTCFIACASVLILFDNYTRPWHSISFFQIHLSMFVT